MWHRRDALEPIVVERHSRVYFRMARFHVWRHARKPIRAPRRMNGHNQRTSRGPRPRGQPSTAGPHLVLFPSERGYTRRVT